MTWEFQGDAVMLLLCFLRWRGVWISRAVMATLTMGEGIVYGAFIWNVVASVRGSLADNKTK